MTKRTMSKRIPVPEERQCTAHKYGTTQRCQSAAIKGGNVCVYHGGAADQVRKAADRSLLEMAEPALAALIEIVTDKNEKTTPTRLAAAKDILDRVGLGAVTKHELDVHNSQEERTAAAIEEIRKLQAQREAG